MAQDDGKVEWLKKRSTGIGSSDAATVCGLNPYKSLFTLWSEKVGLIEPDDLSGVEAVEWGVTLEEPVARKYAAVTGRTLIDHGRHAIRRSEVHPWRLCTLDREIAPIDDRGPGNLEIKTAGAHHAPEWEEGAPSMYYCQFQHQLAVTGWQWGSIAVLIGGQKFRWIDLDRDQGYINQLIEAEAAFWQLVESETPPDVDNSDSTALALRKLYPRDTGDAIALPADAYKWQGRRREIQARIKELAAEQQGIENHIKAALGKAAVGLLPDGSGFSYKTMQRSAYSVPASEYRVLREVSR